MGRLERLKRWLRSFAWPADRRGWGTIALLVVMLAHTYRYVTFVGKDTKPYSDGFYTWVYARSLAFDHDIELTNDYALCGDPYNLGTEQGGGRPANPFYFGPAVVLTPVLWVLHHAVPLDPNVRAEWKNACSGPYVQFTGATSIFATALTVWLAYRIARRWYGERASAIAMVVMGLASPLNVYGTLAWHYSHLWAALAVAVALLSIVRAREHPTRLRWIVVGLACGFAALMRMQESLWLFVATIAIVSTSTKRQALERGLLVLGAFACVFSVQLVVFQKLFGWPFILPQGKLYVQLGHAHPWLLLFGARSGLLYWTPLVWLSILGIPWFVKRSEKRSFAIGVVAVSIVTFYIASAALSWTGAATLGARVQTSLVPALFLPTAAFLEVAEKTLRQRRWSGRAALLLVITPCIVIGWNAPISGARGVSNSAPSLAPALYSGGVGYSLEQIYDKIGNPATLPAGAVFYARYGAPPRVFDALATDGLFAKSYRTGNSLSGDTLVFAKPPSEYWSTGLHTVADLGGSPKGVGLGANERGRFLVTLFWPWTTKIRVTAKSLRPEPTTLTLRTRTWLRGRNAGTFTFHGEETLEVNSNPNDFDSGINEVLLSSDGPLELKTLQWIDDGEHDRSLRLFK